MNRKKRSILRLIILVHDFFGANVLKLFFLLFLSLGCNLVFAETNYQKHLENFSEAIILEKYDDVKDKESAEKIELKAYAINKIKSSPPCTTALQGKIIGDKLKPNTTVKISCNDQKPWAIYTRVKVKILLPTVVASQRLSKKQILNKTNIEIQYVEKSRIRSGAFSSLPALYGSRLKRNISKNKAIKDRDICIVCKGDNVSILAIKGSLEIKTSGIALSDANIGSTVRVKNTQTQRIVVGVVTALKKVQVSF